jgi:hypothetical protein
VTVFSIERPPKNEAAVVIHAVRRSDYGFLVCRVLKKIFGEIMGKVRAGWIKLLDVFHDFYSLANIIIVNKLSSMRWVSYLDEWGRRK